ncbi:MAG: hypothetical protein ABI442_03220 [Gemmatimonadaceae bacterium]
MRIRCLVTCFVAASSITVAGAAYAQDISVMAQAIPVVTRADPTATRTALTEGYLSQPVLMAHASYDWLRAVSTLNLEGLTLKRGELSTGGYGEGYVDRRHPHSYVHQLLIGVEHSVGRTDASLFFGRGFAPFGSDDPMMRPLEKFPINHHLSQILERVVGVVAVRRGPLIGEFGTFNGDEPTSPGSSPDFHRFGDSWSARLTALPLKELEFSASTARVRSPEVRVAQAGLDQRKENVVARWNRETPDSWRYALAEYAKTGERDQGALVTSLSSILGEAAYCKSGVIVSGRLERTDRAEEEQLADPFRTPRPSVDLANLGVSRWTTITASISSPAASIGFVSGRPFVEIERLAVGAGTPAGIFSALNRYGADRMWMLSAGIRLRAGMMHDRMGRYGAAVPEGSMAGMAMGTSHSSAESDVMPGMSMGPSSPKNRCSV